MIKSRWQPFAYLGVVHWVLILTAIVSVFGQATPQREDFVATASSQCEEVSKIIFVFKQSVG